MGWIVCRLLYFIFNQPHYDACRSCDGAAASSTKNRLLSLPLISRRSSGSTLTTTSPSSLSNGWFTTSPSSSLSSSLLLPLLSLLLSSASRSFSLSLVKSARQLLLETSSGTSTKKVLPTYLINWTSINDIRIELKKYDHQEEEGEKLEDNLSSLLSKFSTGDLKLALVATVAKLQLDVKELPLRKNKLIELFSQLIFNEMSILVNLTKSATRYVLYNYSRFEQFDSHN